MILSVTLSGWMGLIVAASGGDPAAQGRTAETASQRSAVASPLAVVEPAMALTVVSGRSRVLRSAKDIRRAAIDDTKVSEIVQVNSRDILVLGKKAGTANLSVWTGGAPAGSTSTARQSPAVLIQVRVTERE